MAGYRLSLQPTKGGPPMLHAGLDLSRKRLDFDLRDADGVLVETTPDAAGQAALVQRMARRRQPVRASIESMKRRDQSVLLPLGPQAMRNGLTSPNARVNVANCRYGFSLFRSKRMVPASFTAICGVFNMRSASRRYGTPFRSSTSPTKRTCSGRSPRSWPLSFGKKRSKGMP